MSGIAGILRLDGAPADQSLLDRMTRSMKFRGPDSDQIWISGPAGFAHTLLKTRTESEPERQPFTLDGEVWIVADARVDARRDLLAALAARGEQAADGAADAELLLRAYRTWRENCVDHLLGDFAFAIWDGPRQQLFCARDHFGIKPFYFARLRHALVFSNTLDCVRLHPGVSDALNEAAVGDFLVSDFNQDPSTTVFADIKCLAPAHVMTCAQGGDPRVRHYWTLPVEGPLRYKQAHEYVDHFRELLQSVVSDRVGTDSLAVYMSGGLDSTAAAASARDLMAAENSSFDLQAHTVVYDRLIPDEERHYSGLAAAQIGIPVSYLAADDYAPFDRWEEPELRRPEPVNEPLRALAVDQMRRIAGHSRVAFYCEGPDNLLHFEWRPYARQMLRQRRFGRLAADAGRYIAAQRRIPFIGRVANRLHRRTSPDVASFPEWLNPAFASRTGLMDRWRRWNSAPHSDHPIRSHASASLQLANWRVMFEGFDPGATRFPVEVRHPFMDLRMVRYLLAVPPIPWCGNKHLLREAMRGVLPESVRRRPKTGLTRDPVSEYINQVPDWWRTQPALVQELMEYVDERAFQRSLDRSPQGVWANWINLRPFALNWWLRDQRQPANAR